MATIGETTRPAFAYDSATDTWVPVGVGPHAHTPAAIGAIASSVVTTKGDLIVATGSGTVVRQGVGADGSVLMADSSQADGVSWAGPSITAGKNAIINGGFDFFQRSTFNSQTSNGYNLDRWYCSLAGTVTITQQTTGVPSGSKYCARVAYNAAGSVGNLYQALESGTVATMQGKTVTLSVKLRRNASFAANLSINVFKNATADTLTGGTWSLIDSLTITNANLPTGTTAADWYLATLTVAIPNDGTANGIRVTVGESATGASGAYYEAAQFQLEVGSVATPFARNASTIQGELAACQRYYERTTPNNSNTAFPGFVNSTTSGYINWNFKTSKRATPTITLGSGAGDWAIRISSGNQGMSGYSVIGNTFDNTWLSGTTTGLTAGDGCFMVNVNQNAYIEASAEL